MPDREDLAMGVIAGGGVIVINEHVGRACAGDVREQEAVDQLVDLQRHAAQYARRDGPLAADEQNGKVVADTAECCRSMFSRRTLPWKAIRDHLTGQPGEPAKFMVWEHNYHLGDARATVLELVAGLAGSWFPRHLQPVPADNGGHHE